MRYRDKATAVFGMHCMILTWPSLPVPSGPLCVEITDQDVGQMIPRSGKADKQSLILAAHAYLDSMSGKQYASAA